eukprot:36235-Chlamydomonas_euryale.AAC.8
MAGGVGNTCGARGRVVAGGLVSTLCTGCEQPCVHTVYWSRAALCPHCALVVSGLVSTLCTDCGRPCAHTVHWSRAALCPHCALLASSL